MTIAMNAIANQVIRNLGRSGRNAGWPYFDGTFRDYPAFKRKFESFQMNYHRGTPTRELFQQFREMCLPEKIAARIKLAETMVRGQEPVHQRSDAGHQDREHDQGREGAGRTSAWRVRAKQDACMPSTIGVLQSSW
jgi:hypothetical protein